MCQFQVYSKVIQLYIYTCIHIHTHTHIYIYIFFFRFFSIIGYYKILSIVPCAIKQVFVGYLFHIQQCVYVNPKPLIYPSPLFFQAEDGIRDRDVTGVQTCALPILSTFFRFFSIIGFYKILNIVPCAIQQVLVVYLFYIQQCVYVNPKPLIYPPLLATPFGNHKFVSYACESISVL